MNWLDLGIILFVIILLIIGIKRGFMKSVLSHFSFGVNCLISYFLCQPIKWLLSKVGVYGAIASSYSAKFIGASPVFSENLMSLSQNELASAVSTGIDNSGLSGLSKTMFKWFLNTDSLYNKLHSSENSSRTLSQIMSNTFANFFTTIIAFVACILIMYLLVFLFKKLAEKLRKCGFVKFVDGAFGAVYGLFRCFILALFICIILKILSPFSFMTSVTNYISESFFGKLIYNQINLLIDAFFNFK